MAATFNAATELLVIQAALTSAAGASYDYTPTRGIRVVDLVGYKTAGNAGAGDNVQVLETANAITENIALGNDTIVFRATTITTANADVAAGGTLRITTQFNTDNAFEAFVLCLPN